MENTSIWNLLATMLFIDRLKLKNLEFYKVINVMVAYVDDQIISHIPK